MKRIDARSLLEYSTDDLWDILTGEFTLVFPDGEIKTNARETLYSSYAWEFHRRFTKAPLLKGHHVQSILNGKRLSSDTHLELLGVCMWNVYDTYIQLPTIEDPIAVDRDPLSEMVYRLTNRMYNDLSYRCEKHVVSLDIVDFVQVLEHPAVAKANDEFATMAFDGKSSYEQMTKQIEQTYEVIRDVLQRDHAMDHNPIALGVRSKFAKMDSVLQCVGPRGFLTDTDSYVFEKVPVTRGYAMGIRLFVDSFVESRSAAKSLIFSKAPLQQAEYFSRRLQLMSQIVQHLHHGDCGSTKYLEWKVRGAEYREDGRLARQGDLKQLVGKYYLDEKSKQLRMITADDKQLVGKYVKLRSVMHCAHPDPYGVCSTCFGELSLSVPTGTNLGHMCCTSMTQKSSQSVLSVKHMDSSSAVEGIQLGPDERRFLRAGSDENSYLLAAGLKGMQVTLKITPQQAEKLTDIMEVKDVRELAVTRVSELDVLGLSVNNGKYTEDVGIQVNIGRRLASMTYELLQFIRTKGWGIDSLGNYTIDLKGWDWEQPILLLPLKHFNMADHSREIAETLESSVEQMQARDKLVNPDDMLLELFDLINAKLSVNLAVVEVTQLGAMIRSAEQFDYALPKPWTDRGVGVMSMSMMMRSLSSTFAYEGHRDVIVNPMSYVLKNRPDHPMDAILMPAEVLGPQGLLAK